MRRALETRRMLPTVALVGALCTSFAAMAGAATTVAASFDLFETQAPGTDFDFTTVPNPQTVNFEGNPQGTFDFAAGAIGVGDADTIVQRLDLADLGTGSDTIDS